MVSKFNISFTILCRIVRCNFLNLTCCTKRIVTIACVPDHHQGGEWSVQPRQISCFEVELDCSHNYK